MSKEKKCSEHISEFLNFIELVQKECNLSTDGEKKENALTQDLLHKLELENLSYSERSKVATQLKNNRRIRRKYKDKIEIYEPLIQYFNENKRVFELLKQVLGKVRKIETKHETRTYTPKVK